MRAAGRGSPGRSLDESYHTDEDCPIGRLIPPELLVPGKGAARLCPACEAGRQARRQGCANR